MVNGLAKLRSQLEKRRLSIAILGSLLLHLAMIALVLWTPASRIRSVTDGRFQGVDADAAGFNPVAVSLVQSQADKLMVKAEPVPTVIARK